MMGSRFLKHTKLTTLICVCEPINLEICNKKTNKKQI